MWIASIPALSIISLICFYFLEGLYFIILSGALLLFFIPVAAFFRDPERKIGQGVVSPADGKITKIEMNRDRVLISIFMNVHNVHVNRMPWDGTIENVDHISGGFVPAFDKDSDTNERFIIRFRTTNGTWEMKQIAGAVARRIVPYVKPGDVLKKGQRFGMIRFGSRVDIDLKIPKGQKVIVSVGDMVLAGTSSLTG